MKAPAFQLYAADFYVDTAGWTATEVGVYLRLLLHQWVEGPLPNDINVLTRITGVDRKTMGKFWLTSVGKKFIQREEGTWENSRLEVTRQQQLSYIELQKNKANIRWHKNDAVALNRHIPNGCSPSSSSSPSLTPLLVVSNDTTCDQDKPESPEKVDNCPHQKIVMLYHRFLPANPKIKQWTDGRRKPLRARWNEVKSRQNLEYWEILFVFISKSAFLTGKRTGRGDRPFLPGLEWMVKAENFAKIIEGRYHQEFMTEADKHMEEARRISEVLKRMKEERDG